MSHAASSDTDGVVRPDPSLVQKASSHNQWRNHASAFLDHWTSGILSLMGGQSAEWIPKVHMEMLDQELSVWTTVMFGSRLGHILSRGSSHVREGTPGAHEPLGHFTGPRSSPPTGWSQTPRQPILTRFWSCRSRQRQRRGFRPPEKHSVSERRWIGDASHPGAGVKSNTEKFIRKIFSFKRSHSLLVGLASFWPSLYDPPLPSLGEQGLKTHLEMPCTGLLPG